eukprot:TRINITY_DN4019_c0_g1_i1.p1 TRINITY_DN4019_c0_g1~~TRINITY_DN4019_c0_g1_i1.p1  ORF type:complete len:276 (-),score=61.54 TRINITY_DN4019_c0_g1_i1:39-866(-)
MYLVQGETIYDDRVAAKIHNFDSEVSDFFVITYRVNVSQTLPPENWNIPFTEKQLSRVIYFPGSTWTSGRNKLLQETEKLELEQGWRYLYTIFLDDDFDLFCAPPTDRGCWPAYEKFLLDWEPAVGTAPYPNSPPDYDHVRAIYYQDAINSAFHADARQLLLPYVEKHDKASWYYSQLYIIQKAALFFGGHALQSKFYELSGGNPTHRDYPRMIHFDPINREIESELIPEPLRPLFRHKFHAFDPGGGFFDQARNKTRRYDLICPYPDNVVSKHE